MEAEFGLDNQPSVKSNEPPYSVMKIHMEDLVDATVRLKIWQDTHFKRKM